MRNQSRQPRCGNAQSQLVIIGGGFAAGMLIGGWLIFGPDAGAQVPATQTAAEGAAVESATPAPSAERAEHKA